MKKQFLLFSCILLFISAAGQDGYWQQQVNYAIKVSLVDSSKRLNAEMRMQYINHSPDTLHSIWIHVWPNAFKNDRTAFSEQQLQNNQTDFYFSDEKDRGYINTINFSADGHLAETRDHPIHQDIIQVLLPTPLLPQQSVELTTEFHVKLPKYFSRLGYHGNSMMITHWYPKAALYDKNGWHPMPYLDYGEYYQDFGNYEVEITTPEKYIVAATGEKMAESSTGGFTSATYRQENVTDFAWFAHPEYRVLKDTLLIDERIVDVFVYHLPASDSIWQHALTYTKQAVRSKSNTLGEYPLGSVKVVEGPSGLGIGGMEYPGICIISDANSRMNLDYLIHHEVGHNWFYGILSSNERAYPWLDEGLNSYYDNRYMREKYGSTDPGILSVNHTQFLQERMPENLIDLMLQSAIQVKEDQPIQTRSEDFTANNYSLIAYSKAANWMEDLETLMGKEQFDAAMKSYYEQWKFKHPSPNDFQAVMQTHSEKDLSAHFLKLHQKGNLSPAVKKQLKLKSFFSFKETEKYSYIYWHPIAGYNFYDGIMPGLLFHNYTLPAPKLRFLLAPMYGTRSRSIAGTARLSYDHFLSDKGNRIQFSIAGSHFTVDNFKDSTGKINHQPYTKIVPAIKYVFAKPNPRSHVYSYLQWKTFFIRETGLSFQRDTIQHVDVISYPKLNRYVNRLEFAYENNRKLYPYRALLQFDQGDLFLRAGFTGNYYFNYAKQGGLNLRVFAGKFVYLADRTFTNRFYTDAYHLNLSGAKGYEDYTYSNYFIGRNEFEGFSNQQILIRDGAFKVRTDLLANKIGKSDNWLAAINLTSSIPNSINPLAILPVKIPVKLFADLGTYAEAWDKNAANGKILFDAGLQFSFLQNSIQIYVPLLYSKQYADYFKSTIPEKRFWKTISFSINFQDSQLRKWIPYLNL